MHNTEKLGYGKDNSGEVCRCIDILSVILKLHMFIHETKEEYSLGTSYTYTVPGMLAIIMNYYFYWAFQWAGYVVSKLFQIWQTAVIQQASTCSFYGVVLNWTMNMFSSLNNQVLYISINHNAVISVYWVKIQPIKIRRFMHFSAVA